MKLNLALIDELRNQQGWSRAELARKAGVTPAALSRLFSSNGKRSPTLKTVGGLANAFEVSVLEIIIEDEEFEEEEQAA